jgi:hypothetical protein
VKFAHAGDDRLAGFFIRLDAEGRIFSSQAVEREAHLFLVALVFGSMAIWMTGSGNSMRSRMTGAADRKACRRWWFP